MPCLGCLLYDKESSKTIHTLPCIRTKLPTISLYRTNNLGFTKRFDNTRVTNVPTVGPIIKIEMDETLSDTMITLKLRRFVPIAGDRLGRTYADSNGVLKEVYKLPYCLADTERTADEFREYIKVHVLDGLLFVGQKELPLVGETMKIAEEHMRALDVSHGFRYKSARSDLTMA